MILLLAVLRELGPVVRHPFFVVEPAARVRDGQGHRGQALGGRVDDHHRVPLPRLAGLLVSNAAPEVDDLLAALIGTAGAAQLPASSEVLGKRLAHGLEAGADESFDDYALYCGYGHNAPDAAAHSLEKRRRYPFQGNARACDVSIVLFRRGVGRVGQTASTQ